MKAIEAIARLRSVVGVDDQTPMDLSDLLPRHFPVTVCVVPELSVQVMYGWLVRHRIAGAAAVAHSADRRLRGGALAQAGRALLFVDGADDPEQKRYTLAHEAGHYLLGHRFPREDLLRKLGPRALEVLDGMRPASVGDRVDALLHRTSLRVLTHLLDRGLGLTHMVMDAEAEADAFALEALAPMDAVLRLLPDLRAHSGGVDRVEDALRQFGIPRDIAAFYAPQICCRYGRPLTALERLGE